MALETLKDVKEIGGFKVSHGLDMNSIKTMEELNDWYNNRPVRVNHDLNEITFSIQDGPIKEVGVNGCQVDTLIHAAKMILEGLNAKFPSEYNELAINKLGMALAHLAERTKDREARGVEGTSNA